VTQGAPGVRGPTAGPHAKPVVLVVDDCEDNRDLYRLALASEGFEVHTAANGCEAVERARALRPHCIVMDLSLPVMDEWTATRRLKADGRTKDIPVVALTGHSLKGYEARAREAGCDAFLTKPCLPEELSTVIRGLLLR
jgi:two-component system cell cycle response regulator DivK